jgi:sulfonate transport system substrate-binding protein
MNHRRLTLLGLALATLSTTLPAFAQVKPELLRIGFQKSASLLTLQKTQGTLERRLAPLGVQVKWVEFPAGPQLLEGLNVGAVDVGFVGEAPPIFAQAAGAKFVYIGNDPAAPEAEALVVPKDSPIKTVADLKGKKVALNKGSNVHYLLVKALEKHGLKYSDIQPVFLPPADARAAFERGAVDAWAIWDPYYAAAEIAGNVRVLATSRGLTGNNTFYLAGRALAGHEPTLRALFAALTDTDTRVQADRKEAARLYADFAGLGLATVHRVLERRQPSPVAPLSPALIAEQQKVADAFAQLGLIPKPIRVADIVWTPGQALALSR